MKTRTYSGNQSFLKELNIISSLRAIRSKGLISRAELADTLGLNRSTITAIVNTLTEEELVLEVGIGSSMGGRPPKLLQFNAGAAYAICLDWSSDTIKMFITDLKGEIFFSRSLPYSPERNTREQIAEAIDILETGLSALPQKRHQLLGIAIGVPGIVDRNTVNSYDLGLEQFPLAECFSAVFDCPVIVETSANVGLTAERYFGCGFGEDNICYIRLNKGISAGILYQDRIYRGSEGFVGNVGHFVIDYHGKKCVCGNRGCWQNYASEQALLESCARLAGSKELTVPELIGLVRDNNPDAARAVREFSEYLGTGIGNLVNTVNPGLIVIDSALAEIGEAINRTLFAAVDRTALPYAGRNIKILFSTLGEKAIVYGATALILEHVFSPPNVVRL